MAFALTDVKVTINSVDVSAWVRSVGWTESGTPLDTTCMGDTAVTRIGGLTDGTFTCEFLQSFAASEVYDTIAAVKNTVTTVTVKPTSDATSATNEEVSASVYVSEWPFLDGTVGDLATIRVSWPLASAVTVSSS